MGFQDAIAVLCGAAALLCYQTSADILFSHSDPVTVSKDNVIGTTPVVDSMHFEFDVVMHSIPSSSGWNNVFTIQPDRPPIFAYPGLYVHETAGITGWSLSFEGWERDTRDEPLVAGKNYHFEMDWTQSAIFVKINGKTVWDASTSSHTNYDSLSVYVSDPNIMLETADATVSNIVISTDLSCWVTGYECADDEKCGDNGDCGQTGQCIVDSDCESYEVCGEDGQCGRYCDALQIDDYLLRCSAEFEGNEADIAGLQSDVSGIHTKIEGIEADMSSKDTAISGINTEIQSIKTAMDSKPDTSTMEASIQELRESIEDIELHLLQLSGHSAHTVAGMVDEGMAADSMMTLTAKDMAIVALLAVNLVIIATLCVVCRAGSGGKYVYGQ